MAETIALVTGANKGIGKEIARQLAARQVLVLMAARERERGVKAVADVRAEGLTVEFIQLDVTSQQSVDDAADEIERRYGWLDILVNNAGIALDWLPGSELTMDVLLKTFETNTFGAFRVTKAMLPLLKKSKRGRIVNLTSGNGSFGFITDPKVPLPDRSTLLAYASSKAALNMMTVRLANELQGLGIKVNAADPGFTATDMNRHRGTRTVEEGAASPVRLALLPDDGPTGEVFGNDGPEPW
ncbi:MAG TPA: SDR family oxidoreductase [Terriglobia bacterium]|nr:SDR family oxidoreductase [Terriglobia bacterium]